MMKRFFAFLLVLVFSISIVGCGNASANANTVNFEPINTTQAESEPVSEVSMPEVDNSVVAKESRPSANSSSKSLYTLPVGTKGEEWSEEQLDEYLASCKAYHENCKMNEKGKVKIDLDEFMKDFGFEYVGTFDEEGYDCSNIYWKQVGNTKVVTLYTERNFTRIYLDNGTDSAMVTYYGIPGTPFEDDIVTFRSENFVGEKRLNPTSLLYVKSIAATLYQIANDLSNVDCARMPFPTEYTLDYSVQGSFNLKKDVQYKSNDVEYEHVEVYK